LDRITCGLLFLLFLAVTAGGSMRNSLRFEEYGLGIHGMNGVSLDFLEFFINQALDLARIGLLPFLLSLPLLVSAGDQLLKLWVDSRANDAFQVYFNEAIGGTIWQVVHTSVIVSGNSPEFRHVITVVLVCDRVLELTDRGFQGQRQGWEPWSIRRVHVVKDLCT